jgi:membrane dipeptidase
MGDAATRAEELHRRAIVIDSHSDILIPITDGKMRLADRVEVPAPEGWQPFQGLASGLSGDFGIPPHTLWFGPMGQFDVPRFLEGGVTAQVCAIYIDDGQMDWSLKRGLQMALQLHRAEEQDERFEVVTRVDDIPRLKHEGKVGGILSFEGSEALGSDPDMLDIYHKLGLRMASLTHSRRNVFADGAFVDGTVAGGLTDRGRRAIRRMNELGIVVDLVHIGDIGFWEILELTTKPVVLSHSTPTMFPDPDEDPSNPLAIPRSKLVLPRDREKLEAIARNGGVLGVIWATKKTLDDVVEDIETALEVMGPDHVGLGCDLYGLEIAPKGLEDISRVPAITRALVDRGHSDEVILKFLGENHLRVFRQVWNE